MPTRFPAWVAGLGRELGRGLLQLVYPGLCHLCGRSLGTDDNSLCAPCRDGLLGDDLPTCPYCACTVGPFANTEGGCVDCRRETFAFESAIRLGPYQEHWRDAVLRLKHQSGEGLAGLLGGLWAEHARARFEALHADVIVPVPLHWWRRWQRGYNQSAELAHGLASALCLRCRPSWLCRVRHTSVQSPLNIDARRDNLRGAFRTASRARVRGLTVLLVDDVMTTGATAHEAASVLRKAGAVRVVVAALCRANP
jgi:ComF family protein